MAVERRDELCRPGDFCACGWLQFHVSIREAEAAVHVLQGRRLNHNGQGLAGLAATARKWA